MYAVIQTGGKQYKVNVEDVIRVEKLENNVGDKITFDAIFTSEDGTIKTEQQASKIKVVAEVIAHGKNEKIVVFKYRAKKRTKSKYGHRQPYTELKIVEIK